MKIRSRRVVYFVFIIIFLVITPLIILYTAGYRYNFQKHKLQKTGILILKSNPEGARIYLNGERQRIDTPARLADLIPEDYSIKIEKDGFYPWQKTLPVKSRLTTFAENITLFKKNLPTELLVGDVSGMRLSPDKGKIAYLILNEKSKELWLFNLATLEKKLLYSLPNNNGSSPPGFEWNRDGKKILIAVSEGDEKTKYIVLDYEADTASTYENLDEFYFEFLGIKSSKLTFSPAEEVDFRPNHSGLLAVLDKKIQDLKVWNTDSGDLIFETEAEDISWSERGDKLLYTKNFEIWFYNFQTNQEILITRFSKKADRIAWINDNYILLTYDNSLKTIELDERDQRNVTDLSSLGDVRYFDIDTEKQKIYFTGSIGNKKGVFELPY